MDEYITKTELKKARGWTESLIDAFLAWPDKEKDNPHYKSGPTIKLYLINRIIEIEQNEAFHQAKSSIQNRRAGARKAVATKKAALLDMIERCPIKVKVLPFEALLDSAIKHFNSRLFERRDYDGVCASRYSSPVFLDRIINNYIRHCLTSYDQTLHGIAGKVGNEYAYERWKSRIENAIDLAYPNIWSELEARSRRGQCEVEDPEKA